MSVGGTRSGDEAAVVADVAGIVESGASLDLCMASEISEVASI